MLLQTEAQRQAAADAFDRYQSDNRESTGVTRDEIMDAVVGVNNGFATIFAAVSAAIPEAPRAKMTTVQQLRIMERVGLVAHSEGLLDA